MTINDNDLALELFLRIERLVETMQKIADAVNRLDERLAHVEAASGGK